MVNIQVVSFDDGWDKIIFDSEEEDGSDLERIDLKELFDAISA